MIRLQLSRRASFPIFMDPVERHPVGSANWSGRISARSLREFEVVEREAAKLVTTLQAAVVGKPWRTWPPDNPWGSVDAWSQSLFGRPWQAMLELVEHLDSAAAHELRQATGP